MSQVHWPMPGRDTTEFPELEVIINQDIRDHLEDFLHLENGISDNNYVAINDLGEKQYSAPRFRTFRKMYERLGLLYPINSRIFHTELSHKILHLKEKLEDFKENELNLICQLAVETLSKYQFDNPLENKKNQDISDLKIHPYLFLWKIMINVENKLHYEEINRVVLWASDNDQFDECIKKIKLAREKINYRDASETELEEYLGDKVINDQVSARISPLYSNAGWGGLIISNRSDDRGFRHLTERSIPYITQVLNYPPNFVQFTTENEWIDYYYSSITPSNNRSILSVTEDKDSLTEIPLIKNFILLAGISGTGKTRFVREQAKLTGNLQNTYCLIPVRPDWHEPSDLLGFTSRLGSSSEYVVTDILIFIVSAWKCILQKKLTFNNNICSGDNAILRQIPPYWLCLDEMNLAPVEQYFSDFLSILETKHWSWDNHSFEYSCDALLKSSVIDHLSSEGKKKMRRDLGISENIYDELWRQFSLNGISLPFNLIVAGTVNMDETTHSFSRKVIDRAFTIDYGAFFPNDFNDYFTPKYLIKPFTYSKDSSAATCMTRFPIADPDGIKSISFIKKINNILKSTPFELAYRALNELLLFIIYAKPQNDHELQAVWDDFLICKLLPRIDGDQDKLSINNIQDGILDRLYDLLSQEFKDIWDSQRIDLFRNSTDGTNVYINSRCRDKLKWMMEKLNTYGFTNFWS